MMWLIRSHSAPITEPQQGDAAIPDGGRHPHRHQRAQRAQIRTSPANGGTTARMPGQETADEDSGDAEAEILALDDGQ